MADVKIIYDGGTLARVWPLTDAAEYWITDNVADPQFFGPFLVVEPRYLANLARGMAEDGLQLEIV